MNIKRCIKCSEPNHDDLSSYCTACQGTDWYIATHSNVEAYPDCPTFIKYGSCGCSTGVIGEACLAHWIWDEHEFIPYVQWKRSE